MCDESTTRDPSAQFATRDEWLTFWASKHSDAYHPSTREECSHCRLMIELYGPMPPPLELHYFEVQQRRSRPSQRKPVSRTLERQVYERDAYRCQECGSWHDLTIDHILPVIRGGENALENLRALCRSCNSRKGARV
jgi:5-methylcytosine-specific restriction endonuclease McrA